jgi:uncharacterized small protein (DUF1192 family)
MPALVDKTKLPSSDEVGRRIANLSEEIKVREADRAGLILAATFHEDPKARKQQEALDLEIARLSVDVANLRIIQGEALKHEANERDREQARKAVERKKAEATSFRSIIGAAIEIDDRFRELVGVFAALEGQVDRHIQEFPDLDSVRAGMLRRLSGGPTPRGARPSPALSRSARFHGLSDYIAMVWEGNNAQHSLRDQLSAGAVE